MLPTNNVKNCLTCSSFFSCNVANKGEAWVCHNYQEFSETHIDDLLQGAQLHLNDVQGSLQGYETKEELREFENVILKAINGNQSVPVDLRIDDSDIKEAANYYDWVFGDLGIQFKPFARQMWIALKLFGEMCPRCSHPDWFNNIESVPVDYKASDFPEYVTIFNYGVCPKCGAERADLYNKGELNIYSELSVCLGQRSGKSIQTGGLASYHIHKALKTNRPSEFYGLAASTTLTHSYTGLKLNRAMSLLWRPIRDTILDSPWFREYHKCLRHYEGKLGEELLTINDTYINWRRARLLASPVAPNVGTLRGDTRLAGAVDEIGFFRFGAGAEDYVTISADEIHASLANSLATVRSAAHKLLTKGENNVQQAIMFNLSSPSSVFDKIMTLVRASVGSRTNLGVRLPTWEVNPDMTRDSLQSYFDQDPIKAERDFGANPPMAAATFFEQPDALAPCFTGSTNRVTYKMVTRTSTVNSVVERGCVVEGLSPLANQPPSLLSIDSGVTNNSFSLAISIPFLSDKVKPTPSLLNKVPEKRIKPPVVHTAVNTDIESGEDVRCSVQLLIEVIPPKHGKLNFNHIFKNTIIPLLKPFNVHVVVTDRWQNILMLDTLRDNHNVHCFQYSLRYKDFATIKSYLEGNMVLLPRCESGFDRVTSFDLERYPHCFENRPIDHLALQLLTVRDTGRTVDKGDRLTDDSFRALSLAVHYLRNPSFVREYLNGVSLRSRTGGGLIAAPGESASQTTVASMTTNPRRAVIACASGNADSTTNVFSRSSTK